MVDALRRFGRFVVLDTLGEGGMGVVVRAYDPDLDRQVALKLLRSDRLASDLEARLIREAQAAARLSHPNVVTVFEVGRVDEELYVAMELVEGQTLAGWLEAAKRPTAEILAVFTQAGRGLAAAHAAGIVHRDFKPANVLLGDDGRARVADFGIARQLAAGRYQARPGETLEGAAVGTPWYMAPEQHRGEPADARSDQFAFCLSLYEALYGEAPFTAAVVDGILSPGDAVAMATLKGKVRPPPPMARVPSWLRGVLLRGLSAQPAARFPTMDALLAALARDPARRWRGAALAATLVASFGALGVATVGDRTVPPCRGGEAEIAAVWNDGARAAVRASLGEVADRVIPALDRRAAEWTVLHRASCEATRVRREQSEDMLDKRMTCLAARLGELSSFVDILRSADQALIERAPTAVAALPELAPCADLRALGGVRPLPTDPRLRARVVDLAARMGGAGAVYAAGRYRDSLIMLLPSLVEIQALAYRPLEGQALVLLADMARMVDDLTLTALALEDGLSAAEAGGDDRNKVRAMVGLVRVAPLADRPRWARRARATLERMGGDAFLEARLLDVETELAIDVGRVDDALELARRQVALIEPRVAVDHPRLSHALFRLAHALRAVGRVEEALAVNLRMDAVDLPRLGKLHPDRISTLRQRVSILTDLFRYAEAVPAAEEAAEIARVARGSESRHRMLALGALGTAYMMAGRLTEAESAMRESLALHEKILGPSHQNTGSACYLLGNVLYYQGRYADAMAVNARGRAVFAAGDPENPELGVLENNDGDALLGLGRPREALARYQKALALWKNLGPDHPYVAGGLTGMARAYVALGDLRAARPLAERALAMREKSGDPAIADTELALARILEREDPARAVELARRALAGYRKAGPVAARDAAETEAWLARY